MTAKRSPFFSVWLPIALIAIAPALWKDREQIALPLLLSLVYAGGFWIWQRYAGSVDDELNSIRKVSVTFLGFLGYSISLVCLWSLTPFGQGAFGLDLKSPLRGLALAVVIACVITFGRWSALRSKPLITTIFDGQTPQSSNSQLGRG